MIVRGRDLAPGTDLFREVDVCIIGTGAGGGMAARELARAGLRVLALEEGGYHTPPDFDEREDEMIPMLYQERGGRGTSDLGIRILQGRGVGGSTVHNTNLCKRTPPEILAQWSEDFGLDALAGGALDPLFAATERDLRVSPLGEANLNPNNDVLRRGTGALEWKAGYLHHNRDGCVGSGFCELGCSFDAKQSSLKVLVPDAVAHGAEVIADCRADRIVAEDWRRVTGVVATLVDGAGRPRGRLRVRARAVCLAGSAIGTPVLFQRSGLPDPHGLAGKNLHLHPAAAVAGIFDEKIEGWRGIPQVYECTEFLRFERGSDHRIWIVPAFAHPIGAASLLPGFGAAHARFLRSYAHMAVLTAVLHDESAGHVTAARDPGDRPTIDYSLAGRDRRALVTGIRDVARLLFAAGARQVIVPYSRPLVMEAPDDVWEIDQLGLGSPPIALTAVHPMSTMPMGRDPSRSVCDPRGAHHQVAGLYVCDGSLFPTSIGVPPQISIYTFARYVAANVVDDLRRT